jgi:hypothetical protein
MCSCHASLASSTALENSVDSRDSCTPISRKRVRAGSSSATPDKRKSRSACSTSACSARGNAANSGASASACTAAYSARFWPSSIACSVSFSSAGPYTARKASLSATECRWPTGAHARANRCSSRSWVSITLAKSRAASGAVNPAIAWR